MKFTFCLFALGCACLMFSARAFADDKPIPVTVSSFVRAETDMYFASTVQQDGFGELRHTREMTPIDQQNVVRMNRDTLYSAGVFDLDASPVTITLPDPGKRFMSLLAISEDHYAMDVAYAPGSYTYTRDKIGTRYLFLAIRTFADPRDPADMKAAHDLQDQIKIEQSSIGTFEIPNWHPDSQKKIRDALTVLGGMKGNDNSPMFGTKEQVDPIMHLIGTAIGWGGNPKYAAVYQGIVPSDNDGKTVYTLTVKDVPVDGFWSISVYNAQGFFQKNDLDAYSLNNLTARPNPDGSFTIQFGGNPNDAPNVLPIMPGWNYTVRMYRPREAILEGFWKFPEAQPVAQPLQFHGESRPTQ